VSIVDVLHAVNDLLELTVGGIDNPQDFQFLAFFVEVVGGLAEASKKGPIDIIVFSFKMIAKFISTILVNVMKVALFPHTDPACQSDLMLCDYIRMMLSIVPTLLAVVFLAPGFSDHDSDLQTSPPLAP